MGGFVVLVLVGMGFCGLYFMCMIVMCLCLASMVLVREWLFVFLFIGDLCGR